MYTNKEGKEVTLTNFLLNETEANSTWYIRLNGWLVSAVYIDDEDLFVNYISDKLCNLKVTNTSWNYVGHYGEVYIEDNK